MTVAKSDLAAVLCRSLGVPHREAKDFVDAFFAEISAELEAGGTVKLSRFGLFFTKEKPERPGRNPKTGKPSPISARRVVIFHPSESLKAAIPPREAALQ